MNLALLLTLTLFQPMANANWDLGGLGGPISEGLKNLGDGMKDVVTLGEHGRDRDRHRAEMERQQWESEQAKAAAILQEQIKSLEIQIGIYDRIIRDLDILGGYLGDTAVQLGQLQEAAANVARTDKWWKSSGGPRLKKFQEDQAQALKDTLAILESLVTQQDLLETEEPETFLVWEESDLLQQKNLLKKLAYTVMAVESFHRMKELADNNQMEFGAFLEEAMKRQDRDGAEDLLRGFMQTSNANSTAIFFVDEVTRGYKADREAAVAELNRLAPVISESLVGTVPNGMGRLFDVFK